MCVHRREGGERGKEGGRGEGRECVRVHVNKHFKAT